MNEGNYQGREFTTTLQANTSVELDRMIGGMRGYAKQHNLGEVKVLQKERDPDGGYRAVIVAHNWSPIKWAKEKFRKKEPWELEREEKAQKELAATQARREREGREEAIRRQYLAPEEREAEEKAERERKRLERTTEERKRKEAGLVEKAEELEDIRAKVTVAQEKAYLRRLGETRFQRAERVGKETGKVAGALYRIGTLGGPIKGGRRELYMPTGMKGLTATEGLRGMRELTMPVRAAPPARAGRAGRVVGANGMVSAGAAMTPRLGALQRMTTPSSMGMTPIARAMVPSCRLAEAPVGSPEALGRLRRVMTPKGLTPMEKLAYREIGTNTDIDTKTSVIGELAKLGVSRAEASQAVNGLLRKGLVRKDRTFGGEPILEVNHR